MRTKKNMAAVNAFLVVFMAIAVSVLANDPDNLQDVCVADLNSEIRVNGFTCKDPATISAQDFFFDGLAKAGMTNNRLGSVVTAANVEKIPGLNTLGVSMARIDFTPGGLNPPHTHPRATEIIFVLAGKLHVGFITTNNKLISKVVNAGEVFVFPKGMLHFQKSVSHKPAAVIAAFNSQLQGTQQAAAALFTSAPPVPNDVLAMAFNIPVEQVLKIRAGLP